MIDGLFSFTRAKTCRSMNYKYMYIEIPEFRYT